MLDQTMVLELIVVMTMGIPVSCVFFSRLRKYVNEGTGLLSTALLFCILLILMYGAGVLVFALFNML